MKSAGVSPETERLFLDFLEGTKVVDKDIKKDPRKSDSPPFRSIDLHGMQLTQALAAAESFIKSSFSAGSKSLTIVTGKGIHSEGIRSPLREGIGEYLAENCAKLNFSYSEREGSFQLWRKDY